MNNLKFVIDISTSVKLVGFIRRLTNDEDENIVNLANKNKIVHDNNCITFRSIENLERTYCNESSHITVQDFVDFVIDFMEEHGQYDLKKFGTYHYAGVDKIDDNTFRINWIKLP